MEFTIGQQFTDDYPPEAASWCNANGARIAVSGNVYIIEACPEATQEELFERLRAERDVKILASDYLLMPDYPVSATDLEAITAYRTALRDLPAQPGAPWDGGGANTPWPAMPTVLSRERTSGTYLPPSN